MSYRSVRGGKVLGGNDGDPRRRSSGSSNRVGQGKGVNHTTGGCRQDRDGRTKFARRRSMEGAGNRKQMHVPSKGA